MQKEKLRNRSVYQQTLALLRKNVILTWRMRTQCFQELFAVIILILIIAITPTLFFHGKDDGIPQAFLGQLDDPSFNFTGVEILYTPGTKLAKKIVEKVQNVSVMQGARIEFVEDEKAMEAALESDPGVIGVVFQDDTSYRLRFHTYNMVSPSTSIQQIDTCYNYSSTYCTNPKYWYGGFLLLQSAIDSAIIELTTSHSVWDEMKSISGIRMRSPPVYTEDYIENCLFFLCLSMFFTPVLYFLSQNISKEKRKLKEVMKTMGLRDAAFWLSWGLLYAGLILIMSCAIAFLLQATYCNKGCFSGLFLLFSLYGISSICFCFMISSLLKKPKISCFVVILLIFCFGTFSIIELFNKTPTALRWIFSLFCPFAFGTGIAMTIRFQRHGKDFFISNLMYESHAYVLLFDGVLYMLLALYFDKIVPDKYGVPYHPLFFLKKFNWFKSRSNYHCVETNHGSIFSDNAEPVPPEFDGKEVIRINNIRKTYKVKNGKTETLKGLSLNIYEGQITAVLGHNGAGKTTLLNILSGLSKPSDGSATIFNYNISERDDMKQIREITSVCPQFNIQFELLTVKENLQVFAKIKGVPPDNLENEVKNLISLLDIEAIQNTQANRLSGGQKRKLTLGITFLGDPQVLLLDEPTADLDPYSRHQVWAFLNERKAGRTTLFTTQIMDEADILADRKAFISHGKLTCVGSSLFLKKKWGIGYHLRMHINEAFDSERSTSLIRKHIPATKISEQHDKELIYTLPLENVDKFPDLFSDMDHQTNLGILNYGVTMTTLEDVFLKLEEKESFEENDYRALPTEQTEEGRKGMGVAEEDLLLLSDMARPTMKGTTLWWQQVRAVARMHILSLMRERKVWGSLLLLFGVALGPVLIQLTLFSLWRNIHSEQLHPGLYFEEGKQIFDGKPGLLIVNDTGASIDKFIQAVKSQNILVDVVSGKNVSDQLVHNGAMKVALANKKYRFTLMCHMEVTNCFPVLVNIISNAHLQMLNSPARIRIWSHLFVNQLTSDYMWMYFAETNIGEVFVLLPAYMAHFAMTAIHDYKKKTRMQLRVSGLFPSAYWSGLALVDIPVQYALLLALCWPALALVIIWNPDATLIFCLVSFLFGYVISMVFFLYIISFVCRKKSHSSGFWSLILFFVMVLAFFIYLLTFNTVRTLAIVLNVLLPIFSSISFLISFSRSFYLDHQPFLATFLPYLHIIVCMVLLRFLVMKYGRPALRRDPIFRISPGNKRSHQTHEQANEDDDQDVKEERIRIQTALSSTNLEEKPVILVHNLRKEYKIAKACSCCKKTKARQKVVIKNVSFGVKKGEVLGLLGPNGAGKSTTMNVIIGETDPTSGQVLMKGSDAAAIEENTAGFLGYCPQENALWSNLTVKEHLEIFAAVKGLKKDAADLVVRRLAQVLELQENFKKPVKALSAGLTRKLCFALSMLGNPSVMLFDEPTAGMDPKGKRQVWRAIQSLMKDKDQGAILTTHHMEEAEAVCDRVAIMVAGQLRCLGPVQYLKSKFGKNYLLQIKIRGAEEGELINSHILRIFPRAARQQRISNLLVYKIPMKDALPLSKAFFQLEEAKRHFNLEEYSFSLNTLEQVFLEICTEQERDCMGAALDTTFEWKNLQQNDV